MTREEAYYELIDKTVHGRHYENGYVNKMFDDFDKEKKDIVYDTFKNRKAEDIARELYLLIDGDNDLYEIVFNLYKCMDKTYKQEFKEAIDN